MLGVRMAANAPRLYVTAGSHPCDAVVAAFELKRAPYRRVELVSLSQLLLGPFLYGGTTVPGMRVDGERIVGSRAIMRRLELLAPAPALYPPPGDAAYARVLEAERWGDEVFQGVPRRLIDAAFVREPSAMESYLGGSTLPLPMALLRPLQPLVARLMAMRNGARDDSARADLVGLRSQLERIDGMIAEGVLGAEQPNAADLQIGATIRLLLSIGDVSVLVQAHPAASLARYFPPLPGEVPAGALPPAWLAAA